MGQILHQNNKVEQYKIGKLSQRSIQKQFLSGRNVPFTKDVNMGSKQRKSMVLIQEEEVIIVAFRKHTLLPLDDCLYTIQSTIPHFSLHRCLQRHDISRLPNINGDSA